MLKIKIIKDYHTTPINLVVTFELPAMSVSAEATLPVTSTLAHTACRVMRGERNLERQRKRGRMVNPGRILALNKGLYGRPE